MSRSVQETHTSPNPYPHGCGVGANLQKNLSFPRNDMKCPELHITHVWQHQAMEKGGWDLGFRVEIFHDGNSMECKTHVSFRQLTSQITEKNYSWLTSFHCPTGQLAQV